MTDQPALCEFAIDAVMGIHFFLHTPKVFLACRVRQLFAHVAPETPEDEACRRFLQAYGLQLEKAGGPDASLTRIAIRHLQGYGWELLAGAAELDPWSGNMVTLRKRGLWPGTAEGGWETCALHSNRGTSGPYLELHRDGRDFGCAPDLILTDVPAENEADRARRGLLGAYGWLTSQALAPRNFIGSQNTPATPARAATLHYLMCLLLRQNWEPTAYGQTQFGPVPWRVTFRRPMPPPGASPGLEQAWADWSAVQGKAAVGK